MNWEAIGAVGQVLGAVAVFVTLGYLAIQVRHARGELRRSVSEARAKANREVLAAVSEPRALALLVKAGLVEGGSPAPFAAHAMERWGMTRDEAALLTNTMALSWQSRLQVIPYIAELSEMERHDFESVARRLFANPGPWRVFYELNLKPTQHPDVIRYMESVLGAR